MKFDISVPLLGFESIKQVELQKIDDIFMKMQSTTDEHISFTLIDPFVLREYDFEVPNNVKDIMEIDEKSLWMETATLNEFPSLVSKETWDVAIIGAGITCIYIATLLEDCGLKVFVLE